MPYVRYALLLGSALILLGLVCLSYAAWANSLSRNIALSLGAAIGAIIALATQLIFDLKQTTTSIPVDIEYTIDRSLKHLSQWAYRSNQLSRSVFEGYASKFTSVELFKSHDLSDITPINDLAQISFIAMLMTRMPRWDVEWTVTRGRTGTYSILDPHKGIGKCTTISAAEIERRFRAVGNNFSSALEHPMLRNLCLPYRSRLEINRSQLTLKTPGCEIILQTGEFQGGDNTNPWVNGEMILTPEGVPNFTSLSSHLTLTTKIYWWMSQSKDADDCKLWSERIRNEASIWFSPVTYQEALDGKDHLIAPAFD